MQQELLPTTDEPLGKKGVFTLDYPGTEIVLGIVCAVGTDHKPVVNFLEDKLRLHNYRVSNLHVSDWFAEISAELGLAVDLNEDSPAQRVDRLIRAGNAIRQKTKRADFLALQSAARIFSSRSASETGEPEALARMAHIIVSLKRAEEVETLRKTYGPGFFLIGVFADESERKAFLVGRKGLSPEDADALIERDQKETSVEYGQRTRDTFQMADVFVATKEHQYEKGLERFLRLVFGDPFLTPSRDEHSMFLAYAASLRSADLARQVGAALACEQGDVIALGCNDVPAPGGGLYGHDHADADRRDFALGSDSNDDQKNEIADEIINEFRKQFFPERNEQAFLEEARPIVKRTRLSDITEFGRSVHAEMDALTAAGRVGVSFRKATLYTTTFPCHTCTRHIIAAGISRVVYIEPYPKSLAPQLHKDAVFMAGNDKNSGGADELRIPFEPFLGVGPRRFFDLFSLKLSSGYAIERKVGGKKFDWQQPRNSEPRVPMTPTSYLEREQLISTSVSSILSQDDHANQEASANLGQERGGASISSGENGEARRKMAGMENRPKRDAGTDQKG